MCRHGKHCARRRRRGAAQLKCRAHSMAQRPRTCKALGRVECHRHADDIGQRSGDAARFALFVHVASRLRVGPRQAKEKKRAECIHIAAHARLPKPILLGRRVGPRTKLDGIGIGAVAPHARNSQIDNHQRRKAHTGIGRILHARHDDVRRLKVAMDYRQGRLPRRRKTSMELADCIAESRK